MRSLKVLIIEDNPDDAELLILELEKGGYDITACRLDTPEAMRSALAAQPWDIILADYTMPRFSAPGALEVLKQSGLDIPLIVISGTVGEETAVECLKAGAHDFLVKGQLLRLLPAVNRELQEAENRRIRRKAEESVEIYMKKLKQSNEELENFASIASHDLQAPLRKVQAFAGMGQKALLEGRSEDAADYLDRIKNTTRQMQDLVQSLLDLFRVSHKEKPFRKVELSQVISYVLDNLQEYIRTVDGCVEVGELCVVEADANQIQHLFQNLIENGLKFRKQGVSPVIRVYSRVTGSNYCEIVVEDNGIGLKEEDKDKIFEAFHRLHGQKKYPGTGIGLSLVRKIVERHQGRIRIESREGIGSRFIVSLPAVQSPPHGSSPAMARPAENSKTENYNRS